MEYVTKPKDLDGLSLDKKPSTSTSNAQTTPAMLLELVTIVTQIAQLDAMFGKMKASAPAKGSEADKWHQVSVQALETSRTYIVEQQISLIQRLANATGTPALAATKTEKKGEAMAEKVAIDAPPGLEIPKTDDATTPTEQMSAFFQGDGNSLRSDLEKIKMQTPGCALLIRKIKPLGFESPECLRAHCEKFGKVAEVLVSHCVTKPSLKRAKGRVRPAALGFVVMASPEDADKVIAQGEQQIIHFRNADVAVEVQRFRDVSDEESLF
jgi:hypothetical protein